MAEPFKTRAARKPPPLIARAGAEIFADLARKTKFVDPNLADHWPSIVGADIAKIARPGRLTGHPAGGKTLEIFVRSGAAAAEMQIRSDDLLARVNRYFGPGSIARITIRQRAGAATPGAPQSRESRGAQTEDPALGRALAAFRSAINRRKEEN